MNKRRKQRKKLKAETTHIIIILLLNNCSYKPTMRPPIWFSFSVIVRDTLLAYVVGACERKHKRDINQRDEIIDRIFV